MFAAGDGAHPDWRRQGLALAPKVRLIERARREGVPLLRTNTASPAILALNEKLGFRRGLAEVRLVKPETG
jgi:GNAT superfamily N-acetyltransferase